MLDGHVLLRLNCEAAQFQHRGLEPSDSESPHPVQHLLSRQPEEHETEEKKNGRIEAAHEPHLQWLKQQHWRHQKALPRKERQKTRQRENHGQSTGD